MYSQVPPPNDSSCEASTSIAALSHDHLQDPSERTKPDHVTTSHWKKFQELKARREKECGKTTERRKVAMKKKVLKTVSESLSEEDKALLEEEGVALPSQYQRKRKRQHHGGSERTSKRSGDETETSTRTVAEQQWETVKQYLDPNPQLKGVEEGRYADKSKLEERMDLAIERGQFDEAVQMSEKLSQREFASKVATAFDCQEFVKKKKVEDERRRSRKQKLKWRFEHKQRWEMKGNM